MRPKPCSVLAGAWFPQVVVKTLLPQQPTVLWLICQVLKAHGITKLASTQLLALSLMALPTAM